MFYSLLDSFWVNSFHFLLLRSNLYSLKCCVWRLFFLIKKREEKLFFNQSFQSITLNPNYRPSRQTSLLLILLICHGGNKPDQKQMTAGQILLSNQQEKETTKIYLEKKRKNRVFQKLEENKSRNKCIYESLHAFNKIAL